MTAFEKALFYWLEVHRVGCEEEAQSPPGAFARFQFEQLIADPNARDALTDFLDLPSRAAWRSSASRTVDRHVHRTVEPLNWDAVFQIPDIREMALRLGYDPSSFNASGLDARYRDRFFRRATVKLRRLVKSYK